MQSEIFHFILHFAIAFNSFMTFGMCINFYHQWISINGRINAKCMAPFVPLSARQSPTHSIRSSIYANYRYENYFLSSLCRWEKKFMKTISCYFLTANQFRKKVFFFCIRQPFWLTIRGSFMWNHWHFPLLHLTSDLCAWCKN